METPTSRIPLFQSGLPPASDGGSHKIISFVSQPSHRVSSASAREISVGPYHSTLTDGNASGMHQESDPHDPLHYAPLAASQGGGAELEAGAGAGDGAGIEAGAEGKAAHRC